LPTDVEVSLGGRGGRVQRCGGAPSESRAVHRARGGGAGGGGEPEAKREEEDAWTGRAFRLTCDGSRVNLTHGGIPNDGLGASELATYQ
jgi:hypothetical protein